MSILELQLLTGDLEAQKAFYGSILGLPTLESDAQHLRLQVGSSCLNFTLQTGFLGRYHFAFDVPENQLEVAKKWLEARVELITDTDGTLVFESESWNAHMVYFRDPQGNILELIARHELKNATRDKFSSASFLNISEIGLACDNVPDVVQWLKINLNFELYKSSSDTFAPVGDAHGLLILVLSAREWFPNSGVFATPQPVNLAVQGSQNQTFEIPNLPYKIQTLKIDSRNS